MDNKPLYARLLLVAGTGRNSGKTTFVTTICSQIKETIQPICIKISNHFHPQIGTLCHFSSPNFSIYEETKADSKKDSARMLNAGASRAFFIEADHEFVYPAFEHLLTLLPADLPLICESGNLRNYIIPGKFILLHTENTIPKPQSVHLIPLADYYLVSEQGDFYIPENFLKYKNKTWELNIL